MRGIYQIRNTANGRCYIGKAQSIDARWANHRATLQRGSHHNYRLQQDWDAFGASTFEFSVLEEIAPPRGLDVAEARALADLQPYYNISGVTLRSEMMSTWRKLSVPPRPRPRRVLIKSELACPGCGSPVDVEQRQYEFGIVIEVTQYKSNGTPKSKIFRFTPSGKPLD